MLRCIVYGIVSVAHFTTPCSSRFSICAFMTSPSTYGPELHTTDIIRTSERQYGEMRRYFDVYIELSRGVPDSVLICLNGKDMHFGLSGRQEIKQFGRLLDGTETVNELGALLWVNRQPDPDELPLVVLVIGRMRITMLEDELRELSAAYSSAFRDLEKVDEEF